MHEASLSSKTKGPGEEGPPDIAPKCFPQKGLKWCSVLSIGVIGKSAREIGHFWMISGGPFLSRPLCFTAESHASQADPTALFWRVHAHQRSLFLCCCSRRHVTVSAATLGVPSVEPCRERSRLKLVKLGQVQQAKKVNMIGQNRSKQGHNQVKLSQMSLGTPRLQGRRPRNRGSLPLRTKTLPNEFADNLGKVILC